MEVVKTAKGMELMNKRLQFLVEGETREQQFFSAYFGQLFGYAAARIPEISDQYFPVDDAMRTGYFWDYGPFEYWDLIGFDLGVRLIENAGASLPKWVQEMKASGNTQFYKFEGGQKKYYNTSSKQYEAVPGTESFILLDSYREQAPVIKSSECVVHDIGDGVLCLEFTSKSNSIGEGISA